MPRTTEEALVIAQRRNRVGAMYLQGKAQWEIAKAVGATDRTIRRDVKAIEAEWLLSAVMDLNAAKAKELARLDRVEREAWRGWRRSLQKAEKSRAKTVTTPKGKHTEAEKTSAGQAGDPRFLQEVRGCIERRCKLLGIDAPTKHEHGGVGGGPIEHSVSDADRLKGLQRLAARVGTAHMGPDRVGEAERN